MSTLALSILDWKSLDESARVAALARPGIAQDQQIAATVAEIVASVRSRGDTALRELTLKFDGCELDGLAVTLEELSAAAGNLDAELTRAIAEARARVDLFHRATAPQPATVTTANGVVCGRVLRPIGSVGLYVPAGSAPLPSTALMLAVPAQIAGCQNIVMCTPADADGRCDAGVLTAAALCGVTRIFKLGGAQAIAAMAFGTESVPRCAKIFGPGNAWVTEAKRQVAMASDGAAIDLPAGPSEVLVIADGNADAACVAADLLAQAEHGPDSQVLLISADRGVLERVADELDAQVQTLPRAEIARRALASARLIKAESLEQALSISNDYAPEHLILNVKDARGWLGNVENAGSIFLGGWSPEAVGDYCSGTNHVLPTGGHARAYSGVSVASFLKQITVQELTQAGLERIGPCAVTMANSERLHAHARAISLRLERIEACA